MPIKNLTAGLNAASDFFTDYMKIGAEQRGEKREREAMDFDMETTRADQEIQRKRDALVERKQRLAELDKERIETEEQAARKAALWRLQQPSAGRQIGENAQAAMGAVGPFGIGGAIKRASPQAMGDALLDSMPPAQAARMIAETHRRRAAEQGGRLSGAALAAFEQDLARDADLEIDTALSRRLGRDIQRAAAGGLLSGGAPGEEGGEGDSGVADMLTTLAVIDPRAAATKFQGIMDAAREERAWQRTALTETTLAENAYEEKANGLDAQSRALAADAVEQIRGATSEKQINDARERLDDILSGKGRKVTIVTGRGSLDLPDPQYRMKPGAQTDAQIESTLQPAAYAIIDGAPEGTFEFDGTRGTRKLEMFKAMNGVVSQLGMKRHPALAIGEGYEVLQAMLDDALETDPTLGADGVGPRPVLAGNTADERAEHAKALAAWEKKVEKAHADTGAGSKAAYEKMLALAPRVDDALRRAGVTTGIMSPQGRLIAHYARQGLQPSEVDGLMASEGWSTLLAAVREFPETPTGTTVDGVLRAWEEFQAKRDEKVKGNRGLGEKPRDLNKAAEHRKVMGSGLPGGT